MRSNHKAMPSLATHEDKDLLVELVAKRPTTPKYWSRLASVLNDEQHVLWAIASLADKIGLQETLVGLCRTMRDTDEPKLSAFTARMLILVAPLNALGTRINAETAIMANDIDEGLRRLRKIRVVDPDDPLVIDAEARLLLTSRNLSLTHNWALDGLRRTNAGAISARATFLATALANSARARMRKMFGKDWEAAIRPDETDGDSENFRIDDTRATVLKDFIFASEFTHINKESKPLPCPSCGEEDVLFERNRVPITAAFGLYFDLSRVAQEIFGLDSTNVENLVAMQKMFSVLAKVNPGSFSVRLVECGGCGICYVNQQFSTERIKAYYAHEARAFRMGDLPMFSRAHAYQWTRSKALPIAYLNQRLEAIFQGARFLDAGCAEGIMCAHARALGAKVHGVEPNYRSCNFAREVLDLAHVVEDEYGPHCFSGEAFDIIISHHTIEHSIDPIGFARTMVQHLRVGGYLFLQLPCADTAHPDKLTGMGNFHLFGLRRAFIERLLRDLGCELLDVHHALDGDRVSVKDLDPVSGLPIWGQSSSNISILACKT